MNRQDWERMNDPVVARFRAAGGRTPGRSNPLLLLTTTGVRTGAARLIPLNFTRDGDRYVVVGSKGGSASHPAWYRNLVAHPVVTVEVDGEVFRALASTASEPERTRLFDQHAARMPFFDGYRRRVKAREIPVVVLERLPPDPVRPAGSDAPATAG
jgi:deazaflavin-dependent oxidoreductase (nitroreductase family)